MMPNITFRKLLNYFSSKPLNPHFPSSSYSSSSSRKVFPSNPAGGSYQQNNDQLLCFSSEGSSYNWYLKQPTLLFSGLCSSYRCMSSNVCLNFGDHVLIKGYRNNVFRFYSRLPDDQSLSLGEDGVIKNDGSLNLGEDELNRNDGNEESLDLGGDVRKNAHMRKPLQELRKLFPGENLRKLIDPQRVSQIVDLIRKDEDNFESRMDLLDIELQIKMSILVFESLNIHKVSGLRFFRWVQKTNNKLCRSADFCSLMICNCGQLNDYQTMDMLLREFRQDKICLSELAFGFLPLFVSGKSRAKECITHMVELLSKVGGSCYSSGIHSLLQMLCGLDLFDMAKYVMEMTERKVSHLNILVREKCKRGLLEEARAIIIEMRGKGCHADTKSYNFILGSLCKMNRMDEAFSVLEDMKAQSVPADALSYEILIYFLSKLGKVNDAYQLFNQMVSGGIRPRLLVHSSIIEAFFNTQQCEEAYRYVIDSSVKDPHSSPIIYTLLVKEHRKRGDLMSAQNIILEMMDKGLRPNYDEYMKIVRSLKGHLATDLKNKYSRFISSPATTSLIR